jgi:hypothetical protein
LMERTIPGTRPGWAQNVVARLGSDRTRTCVLTQLAEDAVSGRWAQVADFYDPHRLAKRLHTVARTVIFDRASPPSTEGYAAGRFYVRPLFDALNAAAERLEPHPMTQAWREELGIELPDLRVSEQRSWFEHAPHVTYPDHARLVAGMPPSTNSGSSNRVEALALPLAAGATGEESLIGALRRTTPDYPAWLEVLKVVLSPPAVSD